MGVSKHFSRHHTVQKRLFPVEIKKQIIKTSTMTTMLNALLALLLVMSVVLTSAANKTPACEEAADTFSTCTDSEDSPDACMSEYYEFVGKCYSQGAQDCAVATLEFLSLGCGVEYDASNTSCDEVQARIQSSCTQDVLDLLAGSK